LNGEHGLETEVLVLIEQQRTDAASDREMPRPW